jgi:hypothetical protein
MEASVPTKGDDVGSKVAGAMDALSLAVSRDEEGDMDLDIEMNETIGADQMNAHVARKNMKECSIQVAMMTRKKMALTLRIKAMNPEEAEAKRGTMEKLKHDIAIAEAELKEWTSMLDTLENAERSMGRTAPSNEVFSEGNDEAQVKKNGKIDEVKLTNEFPR